MDGVLDFAKLFRVDGIGQILAVLDEGEDEKPCIRFRIPDCNGAFLTVALSFGGPDYDTAEMHARKVFEHITESSATASVKQLIELRDALLNNGEARDV